MRPDGRRPDDVGASVDSATSTAGPGTGPDRSLIARGRLLARLDEAHTRRLITVVAGPGSGKSTVLRAWAAGVDHAWMTASPPDARLQSLVRKLVDALRAALGDRGDLVGLEAATSAGGSEDSLERVDAIAGFISSALDAILDDEFMLVIDDLHEIDPGSLGASLVASLIRNAPRHLHVVLASRDPIPFPIERMAAYGEAAQFEAADLAFTADEVAVLLRAGGIEGDRSLAETIATATSGWPAAVRLTIESLRGGSRATDAAVAALRRPDGPLFAYLAREVFAHGPDGLRVLLRTVTPLDEFSVELCEALRTTDSAATLAWLASRGLFLQRRGTDYVLHDLVRDFVRDAWPLDATEHRRILVRAAEWHARQGRPERAIPIYVAAADWSGLAALIVDGGPPLLRSGRAPLLVEAAERLPTASRTPDVARVVGEAYASAGMSDVALEWLELAAPDAAAVPLDVAWRRAMSHYLRDELHEVIRISDGATWDPERPADVAQLAAWAAGAHRRLGDVARAGELAAMSLQAAMRTDDGSARAAAHTAAAFAAEVAGDRLGVVDHHRLGLAAAKRAGDLLQTVRIQINSTSELLESGAYVAAIVEFDAALELATLSGFGSLRALALMNRGLCNWCLGRLEAAGADYEASVEAYRQIGSRELAYALVGRGDVLRDRGDLELALASYEEGLALAERTGDRQALVPGLYQSAKVLALDNPAEALARAERAVGYLWPDQAWALVALGWIAYLHGDRERAHQAALDAAAAARTSGDRFGAAEALELRTWTAPDPAADRDGLVQAAGIWRELGNPLREQIAELALARLGSGPGARAAAEAVERRLERLGTRPTPYGSAGLLTAIARRAREPVQVRTLGGFRLLRDGQPVALAEWQSKKARDTLKVLVARRGRPIPREQLADAIWPDDNGDAAGNRLSVALSLLRQVLDPDKRFAADRFVITDKENVALNLDALTIDVEEFLADGNAGLDLLRQHGARDDAVDRLSAAEAAYGGDFLEEHPYDEWAVSLREESRATYLAIAAALAEHARETGDVDREVRLRLRLLERDPYDEGASLALVRAHLRRGARGEARAAYARYAARMAEIEVESVPFPADTGDAGPV